MDDTLNLKTLVIEPEMIDVISELDEFKGAWRALSTLAPERLSALRRVAVIESIGSSTRIEGSKLSDREVDRILANIEVKSFDTRDEHEVAGYARGSAPDTEDHAHEEARLAAVDHVFPPRASAAKAAFGIQG